MKGSLCVALALALAACGNPSRGNNDNGGRPDSMSDCTMDGAHRCLGASYQTCTGGQWMNAIDCPVACSDTLGCVECTPGLPFCKDGNVWSCNDDGTPGNQVQACGGVTTCVGGGCVDACADAAANKSYIACEYWGVDLDNAIEVWGALSQSTCTSTYGGTVKTLDVCNHTQGPFLIVHGLCDPPAALGGAPTCPSGDVCSPQSVCVSDAQHSPFAVVVSNPQAKDATVTMTGPGNETITRVIPAGQVNAILPQAGNAIPDQSVDGSTKSRHAYKITSDLPVVAYQFNPLDNSNVFSNDASLLIPRTTFDTDYYVMSYPSLERRSTQNTNNYYGYLTIVAWQDNTQIEVTPKVAVVASATTPPIAAGVPTTFTLNAFEVLQLQAAGSGDLTGTHVSSPNMMSFGVFGGHEAAFFGETTPPDSQHTRPCCADHLEEALFPSSTWGKEFAIARSKQRVTEPDLLRVMAQKANTTVTFTPAPSAGTCPTLQNPGDFCEVKIMGNTEIVSDQPILVGHFLEQATWVGNTGSVGTGDPSMAVAVPTEQYRKDYAFLVPSQYTENYVSISAPATGGVAIDGMSVTMTTFPGGGTHRGAIVPVAAGQHKVTCADGCGILVYGYSSAVSYMFAGGLDLKPIVIF